MSRLTYRFIYKYEILVMWENGVQGNLIPLLQDVGYTCYSLWDDLLKKKTVSQISCDLPELTILM